MLLTVRKEGPNKGRQFYKCAKPQGAGCDFFLWADDANSASTSQNRAANDGPRRQQSNHRNQNEGDGDVSCGCGDPAKLLTVQKDGPNKGRQFYGCAKPRESQCGFFQWADEASGGGANFGSESRGRFGSSDDSGASRSGTRGRGRGRGGGGRAPTGSNERKARKCGMCGEEGKMLKLSFIIILIL